MGSDKFITGVPLKIRAVRLHGRGFENAHIDEIDLPSPGDNQLLARVDAAGICASNLKLIDRGIRSSISQTVKNTETDGKIVLYPHIRCTPLMPAKNWKRSDEEAFLKEYA